VAQERPLGAVAAALEQAARQNGTASYIRACPGGVRRIYLNPSGWQQLRGVEGVLSSRANTLEICHIGTADANHTLGMFNRQAIHVQYRTGTSNWRLRRWGDGSLRPSGNKLYSGIIQLTPSEAQRMQEQLDRGFAAQGDELSAGPSWERGNLGQAYGRSFNCVSFFSEMPLGDHGEPLWQILGLPHSYSGNPRALMNALETQANDRVVGICVYGPALPDFATDPNGNKLGF